MSADNSRRILAFEVTVVLLYAGFCTAFAYLSMPVWDDGWLMLIERSGQPIGPTMQDRPMVGLLWDALSQQGILWQVGVAVHFVVWSLTGLCAMWLWQYARPDLAALRLLPAILCIAPVICQIQFVLVTNVFTAQISCVLTFLSVIFVTESLDRNQTTLARCTVFAIAALVAFSGALISEYSIPTALATIACVVLLRWCRHGLLPKADVVIFSGLLFVMMCGYFAYWLLGDANARPGVRPEMVLAKKAGLHSLRTLAFTVPTLLWDATYGAVLRTIGGLSADNLGAKATLLAVVASITVAASVKKGFTRANVAIAPSSTAVTAALVLGTLVGLIPVLAMGRVPRDVLTSRYWLPVLPIAACLSVHAICMASQGKVRQTWLGLLVFSATAATLTTARNQYRSSTQLSRCADKLVGELAEDGITLAIIEQESEVADYELTARITENWNDSSANHFWAFPSHVRMQEFVVAKPHAVNDTTFYLDRSVRGVSRQGTVKKILLLAASDDGEFRITELPLLPLQTSSNRSVESPKASK